MRKSITGTACVIKENNEAKDDTSIAEDSQSKAAIVSDDMFEE